MGSGTIRAWVLGAALLAAPIFAHAQGEAEAGARTLYRGAVLIDGSGAPTRTGVDILVTGSRIEALIPADQAAPEDARIVNAAGLYVLPGLIDAHVHIATPPRAARAQAHLRRQLYSGVTSVRVMADDLRSVAEIARQARVGETPAPDIYFAALMAGESFFEDPRTHAATGGARPGATPWMQAVIARTDLREAVALARGTFASGVKIYANLPAPLVRAITREAHRQGMPVWAHTAVYPASPAQVAAAGVDGMSHACSLAHQARPPLPNTYGARTPLDEAGLLEGDDPAIARVVADMARRGIILDATVRIYAVQERAREADPTRRAGLCSAALSYAMARQAYRAGVPIAAGTDGETPWDDAFPALHEELELLQNEVNMAPLDVIRAATLTAAQAMGQGDEMGLIAPGRLANLVFTRADPSADVANLRTVAFTVRRGLEFQRNAYPAIRADEAEGGY